MIKKSEYKQRREHLGTKLSKQSVAIIYSASSKVRSNDTEYPYRQNSNFYYLTGFKEMNTCLMIVKKKKKVKTILFVEKKDPQKELWTGKRLGIRKAKKRFLVDEVLVLDDLSKTIKEHLSSTQNLYFDFKLDYSKVKTLKRYSKEVATYKNIALDIQKMRTIKSDAEVELIKKAINITKEAHHKVMKLNKVGMYEYELQASIEHTFKTDGAYSDAYTSIVAGGNNANTLHYIANDKKLLDDTLVLIDAGCEYDYYASDITRTIPVGGSFTPPQKELYELVLSTQKQIINMIKPDIYRSDLQKETVKLLCEGLLKLGIIQGSLKKSIKKELYKPYYPHGIGHFMGLDVHDENSYKNKKGREIALKPWMILTIEPALYIPKNDKKVPKKYRGIGIRIEDDILVTQDGYENLSCEIYKEIEEI